MVCLIAQRVLRLWSLLRAVLISQHSTPFCGAIGNVPLLSEVNMRLVQFLVRVYQLLFNLYFIGASVYDLIEQLEILLYLSLQLLVFKRAVWFLMTD